MSTQPSLFDVPKDHPSIREERAARVKQLKAEHNLYTHCARGDWMGFPISLCHELLKGYLNEEDKKDPLLMFSGYCRLMDEGGLVADHHKTELECCEACVEIIKRFS